MDELYHYGIKGQKWGVRRYQNADGSLTDVGKKRQLRRLSGSGAVTINKGTDLMRVSSSKTSDTKRGGKLYATPDEKEYEYYKDLLGSETIINKGKAFVHKYTTTNDIIVPSLKKQRKIELDLYNDKEVHEEMVNSFMNKGYSKEEAVKAAKPFNAGVTWLKNTPWLLTLPVNPLAPVMPFLNTTAKRQEKLDQIADAMGDVNNVKLNSAFEKRLKEEGYNAYRDTNDRRSLGIKNSIAVIDPDKNTTLDESKKLSKEEFGKAYANYKLYEDKHITRDYYLTDADYEKLVGLGEALYDGLEETYSKNKRRR